MHDLNILFIGKDNSMAVGAPGNQYEFKQAIGKHANCKYVGEGHPDYIPNESVDKTVKRVMPDADWVIDDNIEYYIKHKKNKGCNAGLFISDLHACHIRGIKNPVEWANFLNKANYDGIFMRYPLIYGTGYRPEVFYEVLGERSRWVPWSVNIDKFYPRDEKKYDVSFLGAVEECYPLRKKMFEGLYFAARGHKVLCKKPPVNMEGRKDFNKDEIVGDIYADTLGSTRISIFDCSIYRYPLLKFFEGGASGCLLMSDAPAMGVRLGFRNHITYTEVNELNWEEGLQFFLENPKEVKKIANPCMKMVRKYHTHDTRARQFCKILDEWDISLPQPQTV